MTTQADSDEYPGATMVTAGAETSLLEVDHLAKDFGGVHALTGASFTVRRGSITGLIGPNGAGKSTAISVISGFQRATSGRVRYDGVEITGWPAYRVARHGLIRTFQLSSEFARLTVLENLLTAVPRLSGSSIGGALLGKRYWGARENDAVASARALLERFGLSDIENAYAGELSGGQKRLVEIMRGMMAKPHLLLLDEPFAGVNPTLALDVEHMLTSLRDDGLTIVLVEHEMGAVERMCDTVVVMALGQVLATGTMAEMRINREVIDAYLGG